LPAADYYYVVSRGARRPDCDVYRWTLHQPLSTLPIPLRAPDPDILVDFGAVCATAYARGRFFRRPNYADPLPAVVRKRDQAWVQSVAKQATSRPES
jgi:hypothetical protein